jgi:hypothetical protein
MPHSETYRRMLYRMGYYNYQHGLIYRHLNQRGGWDTHLERCRSFILKALEFYKPGKVTIMGSGWLLELPLAEMVEVTDEICLVDIVHPPEVKQQVAGLKKVKLFEQDVTGGMIEDVWKKSARRFFAKKGNCTDTILIREYQPDEDPGLVISLNILTQLETLPVDLLKRRGVLNEEELIQFRTEVQEKHINFLKKHKSALITDTVEIFTENSGKTLRNNSLLTKLPEGKYKEEWTWNFDLLKSDYNGKKSVFEVLALLI